MEKSVAPHNLASRGYVVATCPLLGTYSRLAHLTVADLETQLRDMEFVIAETRLLPFVDRDRVGLVGYDLGGMLGLILAMCNPWIKAMATIDSGVLSRHFSGLPGNSPHYRESRFVIPWLIMVQGRFAAASGAEEKTLFDRKTAGDSYLYYFDTDNHGAFTSYATLGIESEVPGFWGPVKGNMRRVAETVCRSTGRFFDGYLKKDAGALDVLRREPQDFQGEYRGRWDIPPVVRRGLPSSRCRLHSARPLNFGAGFTVEGIPRQFQPQDV